MTAFVLIGVVLTLIAVAVAVVPLLRARDDTSPLMATALAVLLPAAVVVMYLFVSNHDWQAATTARTPAPAQSAPDMQTAIASLESKLRDDPDDIDNWILLGNSYIQIQQFASARDAFSRALERHDDRRARLGLAEATVLEDRDALAGPAGQVFEDVLADEPLNPKALFYAGMAAMAREDNELVRRRWGRLLQLSPPENVRQILEQQIALLDPGIEDGAAVAPIEVAIDIAPAVRAQVASGDSLFVVARVPNQPGPPIAAVRLTVQSFPLTTELSDANVMLPGRSLNDTDELEIVARVSKNGDAISKPGDVFGDVIFNRQANDSRQVDVVLDQIVGGS